MKIALFGGAFDPPHLGHQQVVTQLLDQGRADQVWLVPVADHPFGKTMTPADHRVVMLQAHVLSAVQSGQLTPNQIKIELYELHQAGPNYSYHTLQGLSQLYPDQTFEWVIGADNVAAFEKWTDSDKILDEYGVIVYPRVGFEDIQLLPGMEWLAGPAVEVSSTQVRQDAAESKNMHELVFPAVAEYIQAQQLYF